MARRQHRSRLMSIHVRIEIEIDIIFFEGDVEEDEYESGALPSYDPSAMHEGSEEPNTHSFYSDEDSTEVEDMQMFEEEEGHDQDTIHLGGGFVPEFEPVEITPVNYNESRCVESWEGEHV